MAESEFRFAAVISHPIQHYSPMFRALAAVPGMKVKVFYLCDHGVRESYDPGFGQTFKWDVPLLDGYEYEILRPGYSPKKFSFMEVDSPELIPALDRFDPDAIWVHGYGQRISWRAVRWAQGRAATIYFGDSELLRSRSRLARALKKIVLPIFFSRCDAFLTAGDNNEAYYRHYGMPGEKLFRGACPVDISRFMNYAEKASHGEKKLTRQKLGIPDDAMVVAFSGKMEPGKRPLDLIEAIGLLRQQGVNAHALFIGDGVLREAAVQRAENLGIASHISFTGFVNQSQLPAILYAADVLAMTSERDAHPLAVTESLVFGHPIVISDRIGCVGPSDTARPGVNALVYPCGDVAELAKALACLAGDEELFSRMSKSSRELAAGQDVSVAVFTVLRILLALRRRFSGPWSHVPVRSFEDWRKMLQSADAFAGDVSGRSEGSTNQNMKHA